MKPADELIQEIEALPDSWPVRGRAGGPRRAQRYRERVSAPWFVCRYEVVAVRDEDRGF